MYDEYQLSLDYEQSSLEDDHDESSDSLKTVIKSKMVAQAQCILQKQFDKGKITREEMDHELKGYQSMVEYGISFTLPVSSSTPNRIESAVDDGSQAVSLGGDNVEKVDDEQIQSHWKYSPVRLTFGEKVQDEPHPERCISSPTKPSSPIQIRAVVRLNWDPIQHDELAIRAGEEIHVCNPLQMDGWAKGRLHGKTGLFPTDAVSFFKMVPVSLPELEELSQQGKTFQSADHKDLVKKGENREDAAEDLLNTVSPGYNPKSQSTWGIPLEQKREIFKVGLIEQEANQRGGGFQTEPSNAAAALLPSEQLDYLISKFAPAPISVINSADAVKKSQTRTDYRSPFRRSTRTPKSNMSPQFVYDSAKKHARKLTYDHEKPSTSAKDLAPANNSSFDYSPLSPDVKKDPLSSHVRPATAGMSASPPHSLHHSTASQKGKVRQETKQWSDEELTCLIEVWWGPTIKKMEKDAMSKVKRYKQTKFLLEAEYGFAADYRTEDSIKNSVTKLENKYRLLKKETDRTGASLEDVQRIVDSWRFFEMIDEKNRDNVVLQPSPLQIMSSVGQSVSGNVEKTSVEILHPGRAAKKQGNMEQFARMQIKLIENDQKKIEMGQGSQDILKQLVSSYCRHLDRDEQRHEESQSKKSKKRKYVLIDDDDDE